MTVVIDASVTLTWSFSDETTPETEQLLDLVKADGAFAPALWRLEVANALLVARRRGRLTPEVLDGELRSILALPVTLDHDSTGSSFAAVLDLATQHRLTIYDASYLELARRLGLALATLDAALRTAAPSEGVPLLPLRRMP